MRRPRPTKVISGGQTGVDQAALRAARDCGLVIGGWCPPGRSCESGMIPEEFPLQETPNERSSDASDVPRSERTKWNVRDSDATLILQPCAGDDAGTKWAMRCATRYGRPLLDCDPADQRASKKIGEWLRGFKIQILNVAGPGESNVPGIGEQAYALLMDVFGRAVLDSLSRRLLQIVVGLVALNAIIGGCLYLLLGLKSISLIGVKVSTDPSLAPWQSVDYLFRALSGAWLALGLMLAYLVPSIEKQTIWFRFTCAGIFLMGVGRLLSVVSLGAGANPLVAVVLELILPPALIVWQARVKLTVVS